MPLTKKQLGELDRVILTRRSALLEELRGEVARSRDESFSALAGAVTDPADEAVADLLSDLDQAEVTRDVAEIRELEAARQRLADGSYGNCADCGLDIAIERLRIVPEATRCAACQQVHEKTFAHPNEPRF